MTLRRHSLLVAFCVAHSFLISPALSDEGSRLTVRVRVETKPEPTQAVGLVLSGEGAEQIPSTTIQKVGDKLYDVIFAVDRATLREDSVATAMAVSAGGDITFANVTPALLTDTKSLIANIPECPSEDTSHFARVNQLAPLKALVDIRADRSNLAQRRVAQAMDDETLAKLRQFEQAFGITHAEELSPNLPPQELVDRLARINFALQQYQTFKKSGTRGE
jgi:hypothetical protein